MLKKEKDVLKLHVDGGIDFRFPPNNADPNLESIKSRLDGITALLEKIMGRLDNLEIEVEEMKASSAAVVERLIAQKDAAVADAAAARAVVDGLQALVDAGNTELQAITDKAADLSGRLDAKEAELDAIATGSPPPPPVV